MAQALTTEDGTTDAVTGAAPRAGTRTGPDPIASSVTGPDGQDDAEPTDDTEATDGTGATNGTEATEASGGTEAIELTDGMARGSAQSPAREVLGIIAGPVQATEAADGTVYGPVQPIGTLGGPARMTGERTRVVKKAKARTTVKHSRHARKGKTPRRVHHRVWRTSARPHVRVWAAKTPKGRNKAIAYRLVARRAWPVTQFRCLDSLWTRESNWNHRAQNPSSGAYGIPQALPGYKMVGVGRDWRVNPATQIRWGLKYIKGRYGSPCGAWGHFRSHNWY